MKKEEQGLFFFGLMDHFVSKFIQKNPYILKLKSKIDVLLQNQLNMVGCKQDDIKI
ncbi:hypothetical protein [Candidatus Harpocratesius sp.]